MGADTIKQRAEAEAEAAEAEYPEPEPVAPAETAVPEREPEAPGEPEREPEAPGEPERDAQHVLDPRDGAEAEKAWGSAEKASASYGKRIAGLLDAHAPQLAECPLCLPNLRGYIDTNDAGRVPPEVANVVQMFLGLATEVTYQESQTHKPCSACGALGKVSTGSKVPDWATLTCPNCKGYGFTPPPGEPSNGHDPAATLGNAPPVSDLDAGSADTDPSGEPRILPDGRPNPNFGKWPQFKIAVPPWGATAGLTAQSVA
jgi:hypothetical protein